jgi:YbbR domain-containing protein
MARRTAGIKIVSIGAALLLWMFIKASEEAQWIFEAPLSVEGVKEDLVLVGSLPQDVVFEARATMKTLASLKFQERRGNLEAVIDASFLDEGEQREDLSEDSIVLPPASEIVQVHVIAPKSIQFELDRAMTTELKVVPQVEGQPRQGYYYVGASVEPEVVSITGARSLMRGAKVVFTEEIDLTGAGGSFQEEAELNLSELGRATSEPEKVMVSIEMEGTQTKVFEDVTGSVAYDAAGFLSDPNSAAFAVEVSGPESAIEGLTKEEIGIVIDASELGPGVHVVTPRISLPEGLSLVSIEPSSVEVILEPIE